VETGRDIVKGARSDRVHRDREEEIKTLSMKGGPTRKRDVIALGGGYDTEAENQFLLNARLASGGLDNGG